MWLIMTNRTDDFYKQIFSRKKHSVFVGCLGKKQSGKTDFMLHLMERLHDMQLMDFFASNMPCEAPFEIKFIEDFDTLEKYCRMINPSPNIRNLKRILYFGSEMGKWLPKDQAWKNVEFIEKLQTVRKYGLSFEGDAIDRVDGRVLTPIFFDGYFQKLSMTNPTIAYYYNWSNGEQTLIQNIPRTNIKFDTFYTANFYMHPQTLDVILPLNQQHLIVKKYLECGNMRDTGFYRQEVKRAIIAVLRLHMATCLHALPSDKEINEAPAPSTQIES